MPPLDSSFEDALALDGGYGFLGKYGGAGDWNATLKYGDRRVGLFIAREALRLVRGWPPGSQSCVALSRVGDLENPRS